MVRLCARDDAGGQEPARGVERGGDEGDERGQMKADGTKERKVEVP